MRNCPFNYSGSKSEYPELHAISVPIADMFAGGGGMWSNCASKDIVVNDINSELIRFQKRVYECSDLDFESLIKWMYELTEAVKTDQDKYVRLRAAFNESKNPGLFMALLCTCTNNMIRYNSSGGFNQTWGKRAFNKSTEQKLRDFRDRIRTKNIRFVHGSYLDVPAELLAEKILFLDPPYFITSGGYNSFSYRSII